MLDMIRTAYNVDADKIYGGPSWLDYARFEILAKTKPPTATYALSAAFHPKLPLLYVWQDAGIVRPEAWRVQYEDGSTEVVYGSQLCHAGTLDLIDGQPTDE